MASERLDVRLAPEQRRKLVELARYEDVSITEMIRRLIEDKYEAQERTRRMEVAARMVARELEEVPQAIDLRKQLDEAHDVGNLY